MEAKPTLIKKHIRDVLPGEHPLELTFEVLKKLEDKEEGLSCRICDETGASNAIFYNPVKKYIEEGQAYTAKHAIAEVVNEHIRIELIKDKGSITKEPTVIPFKDNTFDLSKKEWVKIPKSKSGDPDKYTDQKELTKQAELDAPSKNKTTSSKIAEKEHKDVATSAIHMSKIKKQRAEDSRKSPREENNKNSQELDHKGEGKNNTRNEQDSNQNESNGERKKKYVEVPKRKNSESLENFLKPKTINKLSQLLNIRSGVYVNIKAYVSQGAFTWKSTKNGEKKFFECDLSDSSGTVLGSFFEKSRLINNSYYEFDCLKVRVTEKAFLLQQTLDTSYRINDSLDFKRNYKFIEP